MPVDQPFSPTEDLSLLQKYVPCQYQKLTFLPGMVMKAGYLMKVKELFP